MRCGGKCIPQRPARIQASFNRPRTHHRYYSIHVALIYSSALTAARQGTVKIVKVTRKRRITIPKEVSIHWTLNRETTSNYASTVNPG